jgi:peroxiredoxin
MLFPKSIYEPPGDFIFELSGVLQFVAAMVQARLLWRLLRANGARTTSPVPESKVALAMTLPPFDLETITGERVHIPDPSGRLVHLHFRRFAGCPICITHLRALVRRKDEIVAAGIREVIFFHSSASELLKHESDVPYDLIADPQKKYYRRFGVEKSPWALLNVKALWAALLSAIRGKGGFTVENGRPGLPADILIDDHGCVIASKYGSHAYDQWDVDELLSLARNSFLKSHRPNNAAFVDATNC